MYITRGEMCNVHNLAAKNEVIIELSESPNLTKVTNLQTYNERHCCPKFSQQYMYIYRYLCI